MSRAINEHERTCPDCQRVINGPMTPTDPLEAAWDALAREWTFGARPHADEAIAKHRPLIEAATPRPAGVDVRDIIAGLTRRKPFIVAGDIHVRVVDDGAYLLRDDVLAVVDAAFAALTPDPDSEERTDAEAVVNQNLQEYMDREAKRWT